VPKAVLFPVVLALCTIGAYAPSNAMSNVYALLLFFVLGVAVLSVVIALWAASPPSSARGGSWSRAGRCRLLRPGTRIGT